jgi:hypothetical protein
MAFAPSWPATRDLEGAAGLVRKGTVGHTNWRWHARVDGARFFTLSIHWVMEDTHLGGPDEPLWRIEISGQPCVTLGPQMRQGGGPRTAPSARG